MPGEVLLGYKFIHTFIPYGSGERARWAHEADFPVYFIYCFVVQAVDTGNDWIFSFLVWKLCFLQVIFLLSIKCFGLWHQISFRDGLRPSYEIHPLFWEILIICPLHHSVGGNSHSPMGLLKVAFQKLKQVLYVWKYASFCLEGHAIIIFSSLCWGLLKKINETDPNKWLKLMHTQFLK